jgi:hypothetical protein
MIRKEYHCGNNKAPNKASPGAKEHRERRWNLMKSVCTDRLVLVCLPLHWCMCVDVKKMAHCYAAKSMYFFNDSSCDLLQCFKRRWHIPSIEWIRVTYIPFISIPCHSIVRSISVDIIRYLHSRCFHLFRNVFRVSILLPRAGWP